MREYGAAWWSGFVLGMPTAEWLSTSQIPSLVSQSFDGGPFQFDLRPTSMTSVPRIAGVHSTVWIFAISAETISRAVW